MACASRWSRRLKELEWLGSSCPTRGSVESAYRMSATTIEADSATTSWSYSSARKESMKETGKSGEDSSNSNRVREQIEQPKGTYWSTLADETGRAVKEVKKSDYGTAAASNSVEATMSSSCFVSAVEEQIERLKAHWSTLADHLSGVEGEEVAEESNVEEFKALHPVWDSFFATFGYELEYGRYGNQGELVLGEKFTGQAEHYEAQVKWRNPEDNEIDLKLGHEYVLKVFKKGLF